MLVFLSEVKHKKCCRFFHVLDSVNAVENEEDFVDIAFLSAITQGRATRL